MQRYATPIRIGLVGIFFILIHPTAIALIAGTDLILTAGLLVGTIASVYYFVFPSELVRAIRYILKK